VSFRHPALHLGLIFAISASAARAEDAAERGEKLFQYCFACHSVQPDETSLQGPNLRGIVGRPIAAQEGFTYSPAMRALAEREGHWSEALLDRYLAAPYEMVPKTSMAFPGLDEADARSDLIAYLRSTGGPAPVRGSASQAR
jgi:cytochrome c